ncbi:MAG: Uma2 family endonuclease [Actinomycetota bacterium]|nr:Uma2 family endonuclease [Actinomycetota bacterium]
MSMPLVDPRAIDDVIYPDCDDQPMAENALQSLVIRTIVCGFERLHRGRADVFIGGDNFWYPVKGEPGTVIAPDVLVVVDLPQPVDVRTMGSYRQFEHGGRVQLAVEVLSPSNTWAEMTRKRQFYDRHGVDEYWMFEPIDGTFEAWVRDHGKLTAVANPGAGWVSPATGVHVRVVEGLLHLHDPDGRRRWLTPAEESELAGHAMAEAARADAEAQRADTATQRADAEAARADTAERLAAELQRQLAELRSRLAPPD